MNWKFWKPDCKHVWSMWSIAKAYSNHSAQVGIVQTRDCDLCGFTQVDVQRNY